VEIVIYGQSVVTITSQSWPIGHNAEFGLSLQ
jgi:hypothetical protein